MNRLSILIGLQGEAAGRTLGRRLHECGYSVTLLASPGQVASAAAKDHYDLVIAQDGCDGLDPAVFLSNGHIAGKMGVIVLSASTTVARAVQLLRMGAADYLSVDVDEEILLASVQRAAAAVRPRDNHGIKNADGTRPVVTASENMRTLLNTAGKVANANATVLIHGESGTGKELLARFIHEHSDRRERRFVALNCAALPDSLAESELFGYEKGAFTGAAGMKTGKFEQAHQGTLLLDEISEMPLGLQAKLLRAIQEKQVERLGGTRSIDVDVRLIATTNRDLTDMVQQGRFRSDLYYRLRVIPLTVPPLRERREDIPVLIDHFLGKHLPPERDPQPAFSREALGVLTQWSWPGNVRELENTVHRALLISSDPVIGPEWLLLDDRMETGTGNADALVGMTVREMEQKLISQTLSHLNQNRTHAAKMLGISIRTLRNKLKELDSSPDSEKA